MSRMRTISDEFWSDPDLDSYTAEDRLALLLLLTCKSSSITGIYRLNWKVVGAGIGWTKEQILNSCKHLQELGGIEFDEASGWVWVKEWWKHNSLAGAFTGKLSAVASREISQAPDWWKRRVFDWLNLWDREGKVFSQLASNGSSMPHERPLNALSPNTTTTTGSNTDFKYINNDNKAQSGGCVLKFPKSLSPEFRNEIGEILIGNPFAAEILDEMADKLEKGKIESPVGWLIGTLKNDFRRTIGGLKKTAERKAIEAATANQAPS